MYPVVRQNLRLLILSRAAEAAPVCIIKNLDFFKLNVRHFLNYAELADAVILQYLGVPSSQNRIFPYVICAGIAVINYAYAVSLEYAPVFEGRAAGRYMSLIALGELHGYAQRDIAALPCFQLHVFRRAQVDPIAYLDAFQLFEILIVVNDLYLHIITNSF